MDFTNLTNSVLNEDSTDTLRFIKKGTPDDIRRYVMNGSKGSLDMESTSLTELPDTLNTIGGYGNFTRTKITDVSMLKNVKGFLNLQGLGITHLPDNLNVDGTLNIRDTNISVLPANLTVGGSLLAGGTNLTSLPNSLTINGNITLTNTPLAAKYSKEEIERMPAMAGIGGKVIV